MAGGESEEAGSRVESSGVARSRGVQEELARMGARSQGFGRGAVHMGEAQISSRAAVSSSSAADSSLAGHAAVASTLGVGTTEEADGIKLMPVQSACVNCRKSRVKCDKMLPCKRCRRLGVNCEPQLRGRGRPPSYKPRKDSDQRKPPVATSQAGKLARSASGRDLSFAQNTSPVTSLGVFGNLPTEQNLDLLRSFQMQQQHSAPQLPQSQQERQMQHKNQIFQQPKTEPQKRKEGFLKSTSSAASLLSTRASVVSPSSTFGGIYGVPSGVTVPLSSDQPEMAMEQQQQQQRRRYLEQFQAPQQSTHCVPAEAIAEEFMDLYRNQAIVQSSLQGFLQFCVFLYKCHKSQELAEFIERASDACGVDLANMPRPDPSKRLTERAMEMNQQFRLQTKWESDDVAFLQLTALNGFPLAYCSEMWEQIFIGKTALESVGFLPALAVLFPQKDGTIIFRDLTRAGLSLNQGSNVFRRLLKFYLKGSTETLTAVVDTHTYISSDGSLAQFTMRVIPLPLSDDPNYLASGCIWPTSFALKVAATRPPDPQLGNQQKARLDREVQEERRRQYQEGVVGVSEAGATQKRGRVDRPKMGSKAASEPTTFSVKEFMQTLKPINQTSVQGAIQQRARFQPAPSSLQLMPERFRERANTVEEPKRLRHDDVSDMSVSSVYGDAERLPKQQKRRSSDAPDSMFSE